MNLGRSERVLKGEVFPEKKSVGQAIKEHNESKTIKGTDGLGTTTITEVADKLHYAQEASTNAFMAVQGILQAHAEKNNEPIVASSSTKLYTHDEWEKSYTLGYLDGTSEGFTFSDFDKSVSRTWKKQDFKDAVSNAALGLTGEAGEVADIIKKAIYHGRGFTVGGCDLPEKGEIDVTDVKDELSDVLFYVSAMAQEFGFTLEDVARHNKAKLEKRYEKGFTVDESSQKKDKHKRMMEGI